MTKFFVIMSLFTTRYKKIKINGIINKSVAFKYYEGYLNTLNTELYCCIPFTCIYSFHIFQNLAN